MPPSKADMGKEGRQNLANKGKAMPGGRFPITNSDDLDRAIQAVGRAAGGDAGRAKVRRFIIKRAKELGLESRIPNNWAADGSLKS